MSLTKVFFSVGALIALLAAAPSARAAGCQTAADCGKGFKCEIVTAPPPVATQPACPAGTGCPVADPAPTKAADQTAPSGECVEAACTTDADCGPTMVCHTDMVKACSGGSTCPPNVLCFAPDMPPTCTTTNVSTCMYKWQLPCAVDAECGDGFSCVFPTTTTCSGSGGSGTASGSGTATPGTTGTGTASGTGGGAGSTTPRSTPVPPSDTCMTTTSTVGVCTPKATSCTADTDCPTAWTCVDSLPLRGVPTQAADAGTAIAVGEPAPTGNASSIAPGEPAPADAGTLPADPTTKVCQSPFGGAFDANGTPIETVGGGTTGAKIGSNGGTPPATPGGTTNGPSQQAAGAAPSSGGCALGGGSDASLAGVALALLGLVLSRRRR
jgi:hypothetical protein